MHPFTRWAVRGSLAVATAAAALAPLAHARNDNAYTVRALVSDGTLRLLALTIPAYLKDLRGVFLIEEPENGIHPKRLKDVLSILRELITEQSHTQVLMTTHSPYVLDEFKPEEVTLCKKGADGAVNHAAGQNLFF